MGAPEIPGCACGCAQLLLRLWRRLVFSDVPILIWLADAVHVGVVQLCACTAVKWHWPAWIKSLMLLLLRAAWAGWVVAWGVPGVGSVLHCQHPANSVLGLLAGAWGIPVSLWTAPNQPLSTGSTVSS